VYDAAGTPRGSLNALGPRWTGAPGTDYYGRPIEAAFADANPHLRAFALGVYNNPHGPDFLKDLLAAIDDTVTVIEPLSSEQFRALAVLVGRPLALVRCSLGLDLQGMAALDQSWPAFTAAVSGQQPMGRRDQAAFPGVAFPVQLGQLANLNDGLVGYF